VIRSSKESSPGKQLMTEFAKVYRNYKSDPGNRYEFPLRLQSPIDGTPYDSHRHLCLVQDADIRKFFEPAMKSLLQSLDNHYSRLRQRGKAINRVIFVAADGISPYVESYVQHWTRGVGRLETNIQVFPTLNSFFRFVST
jgi:hypothetical protein